MLRIAYSVCCGMDIHKDIIVATIANADSSGNVTYSPPKTFSTMYFDLVNLRDWLIEYNCRDACMESTGKYWFPIWNVLESEIRLVLAHPKYTRAIRGKKTDKKDSKWITELFMHDLIVGSFLPPKDIRSMRELSRYRMKLTYIKVSEKNRFQNAMTVSNINLDSVLSDSFGKTATNILQAILFAEDFDRTNIEELLCGKAKKKSEDIKNAIAGYKVNEEQQLKMQIIYSHLNQIDEHLQNIDILLKVYADKYRKEIDLLKTVPGLNEQSIVAIISETGVDMSVFVDSKHFTSWGGLTPTNNESAGKKHSTKISHAGVYLKPILVQVGLAAIRDTSNDYYKQKYENIKKRRGHKKAIIAIARMIAIAIYYILLNGEEFHPYDYDKVKKEVKDDSTSVLTDEELISLLKNRGYKISEAN